MKNYIMSKERRATFNKSGNTKLGNMWNFSTVYGDEIHTIDFNGEIISARGTCGNHCKGCKNACYVRKSYRYPSVVYSHIKNTIALRTNTAAAFNDLATAIEKARKKPEIIRINQSGELESEKIFIMWCELAAAFPKINFYVYTKNYKAVTPALINNKVPENMTVLFSVWHEYGAREFKKVSHLENVKAFVYDDNFNYSKKGIEIQTYCKAYTMQDGKMTLNHNITCDKCKKCFNRSNATKIIGSLPH